MPKARFCDYCGKIFLQRRANEIYCGNACERDNARRHSHSPSKRKLKPKNQIIAQALQIWR